MSEHATAIPRPKAPDPALRATVRFRLATLDDIDALVPMINEAYLREAWLLPPPRIGAEELRDDLRGGHAAVLIAEAGGTLAGSVRVTLRERDAHFGLLATAPSWQGRGLASLLIEAAEAHARDAGRREMRLECARELGMVPYYEALGYRVVAEERTRFAPHKPEILRAEMAKELR